jgi:hypothetical protein
MRESRRSETMVCMHRNCRALWSFLALAGLGLGVGLARDGAAAAGPDSWRAEDEKDLRQLRQLLPDDVEISLSVSWIEPTGNGTVYLGGSYREPAGSYRSALLVSRDGGRTWRDTDAWLTGSMVCAMRSLGRDHVWCLVSWSREGDQAPYFVFSSSDSGRTWQRSRRLPADITVSLSYPLVFSFTDTGTGLLLFESTIGDLCTYQTADGGITWELVSGLRVKPDDLPGSGGVSQIENRQDEYRAERDEKRGVIRILRRDEARASWQSVGEIPYHYRLRGTALEPRPGKRSAALTTD